MFCHNCGKELPDGSKFCSGCGEKQLLEEPTVPVSLEEPAVPVVAASPVEPAVPAESAAPAEPTVPVEPVLPVEPTVPVSLEEPAVPVVAAVPVEPAAPAEPTAPVAPVVPVRPTVFVQPAAPAMDAAPVQPAAPAEPAAPVQPAAPVWNGDPAAAAPAAPAEPATSGAAPRKKKSAGKVIIGIVAAVLVIAAAAVAAMIGFDFFPSGFGSFFSGGSSDANAYAFLSDGTYELITDLDKGQLIEIASSRSELSLNDVALFYLMKFSPDGKYLYYYTKVTKVDEYSYTGTLCRAEYGKLKQNGKNNDQYIETIASDVPCGYQSGYLINGFRLMEDGSVVYMNADHTLYYYDGEESVRIAKDVKIYETDDAGRIVYITGDDSEGYTLYGVTLDDMDQKKELASNVTTYGLNEYIAQNYVVVLDDFDNILYTKTEDDGTLTLYVSGFEKDAEKLAENGRGLSPMSSISDDEKTYFIAESGTALRLYDYVEDPYAGTDAGLREPVPDDFLTPRYSYEMITGSNLSESDYEELYTTCTHRLYWYGESLSGCCSMEDAFNRTWNDAASTQEIYSITQNFIDRFGAMANEDGFIPVTDEVRAALQGIQSHDEEPERAWQWLWLCYNRRQSGTDVDYESYNAAREEWEKAQNRIALREALQDAANDRPVYTLYCFEDGELTVLQENILDMRLAAGAFVFSTPELITETISMDEIGSVDDVYTLLDLNAKAENYVLLVNSDQICRMSAGAAQAFAQARENGRATLCFTDGEAYLSEENGALSAAAISGGTVGDFSIVSDDAKVQDVYGSTLYYLGNSYESGEKTYGDLYSCANGDSTRLAKDVMRDFSISLYDDGSILAATGYEDLYGFEYSLIDPEGETTVIEDRITACIRVNESLLLYISDGDLYSYDGEERNLIQDDVDYVWSRNRMEARRPQFRFTYNSVHDLYSW